MSNVNFIVNMDLVEKSGINPALIYQELIDKYEKSDHAQEYFIYTIDDMQHEARINELGQRYAIKKLIALGLIEQKIYRNRYFKILNFEYAVIHDEAATAV
jgi:hypothetical protein